MTTDTTERNPETIEEAAVMARDLLDQAQQVMGAARSAGEDNWEIIDASPRRKLWALYSMIDGQRVEVPEFVGKIAIKKRVTLRGRTFYAWTDSQEKAPAYKPGKVMCFLHPDAEEAELMAELGIPSVCDANELRNPMAKRIHGMRLHKNSWDAYQEHLGLVREQDNRDQMAAQTEATLELARAAAVSAARPVATDRAGAQKQG